MNLSRVSTDSLVAMQFSEEKNEKSKIFFVLGSFKTLVIFWHFSELLQAVGNYETLHHFIILLHHVMVGFAIGL